MPSGTFYDWLIMSDSISSKFLILGMPRSRTYWLSLFLGCVHEGVYYYPDYADFLRSDHIGDSTTCYLQIKEHIKGCKKVIIHRDIKEVEASLIDLFGENDYGFLMDIEEGLKGEEGLHIAFNDISKRLREIWNYCKETPFDSGRADEMDGQILENYKLINEVKQLAKNT